MYESERLRRVYALCHFLASFSDCHVLVKKTESDTHLHACYVPLGFWECIRDGMNPEILFHA